MLRRQANEGRKRRIFAMKSRKTTAEDMGKRNFPHFEVNVRMRYMLVGHASASFRNSDAEVRTLSFATLQQSMTFQNNHFNPQK